MIKCRSECPLEKFDGCCVCCPERDNCPELCEEVGNYENCENMVDEEKALVNFQNQQLATIKKIAEICTEKKKLEALEKQMKDNLKEAMEHFGVTKFDSDILKITYIAEGVKKSIDSTKLKKELPEIAEKYTKTSKVSSYIKVEVKSNE